MKINKLAGVLVALAIIGLSVGNALTGHGIKGNKNLNLVVLGTGGTSGTDSTDGTNSTGETNSTGGTGGSVYRCDTDSSREYSGSMYPNSTRPLNGTMTDTYDCKSGNSDKCKKGTVTRTYVSGSITQTNNNYSQTSCP